MTHAHISRFRVHVVRCLSCETPLARYRDGECKVLMARCSHCGTLQQRDISWSSPSAA
jgi:hypothetical protein